MIQLTKFDNAIKKTLECLSEAKRGESRIDFSRSGKRTYQAFIVPNASYSIPLNELIKKATIKHFIESRDGRFLRARQYILRFAAKAWVKGRSVSINIKCEKRANGPQIDLGNENWERFDDS